MIQYTILNNKEFGSSMGFGNNGTDIYIQTIKLTGSNIDDQVMIIYSDFYNSLFNNRITAFLFDSDNLYHIYTQCTNGYFVLPTKNSTGNFMGIFTVYYGINWSEVFNEINHNINNYNATWDGPLLIINCTKYNITDSNMGMKYNLTKRTL